MPPRLARLLAALVAIALVVAAFALRGAISDDDEQTTDTDVAPTVTVPATYRLACDEDLGPACDAIDGDVTILSWSEIRDEAAQGPLPYNAWLTLDPMPAVLDAGLTFSGGPAATSGEPVPVASSALALLTREGRGVDCDGTWACVAAAAADQDVGTPDLDSSSGVIVATGALVALAGEAVVEAEGVDALDAGTVRSQLDDLGENSGDLMDQSALFVTQAGRFAGVVTTEGLGDLRRQRNPAAQLRVQPLEPAVRVGVVLVGLGDEGEAAAASLADGLTGQTVRDALAEAGWDGEPARSTGLPVPDVIDGVREELG